MELSKKIVVPTYALALKVSSYISVVPVSVKTGLLSSALAPLIGFFTKPSAAIGVYIIRTVVTLLIHPQIALSLLHLPTCAGTIYLATDSRFIKFSIVLIAFILFLSHPIGQASWLYSLYWLPPLIGSFFAVRSIFLRAVFSTLTTHAIGSTIWLYTHHTDILYWHSLISIVWIERVISALILTASYYSVLFIQKHMLRITKKYELSIRAQLPQTEHCHV